MAVPIAAGLMAVSGLTLGQPAAVDTLSYPYEVSSSTMVDEPANLTAPLLTGTPLVGSTVSVTNGTWSGSPTAYTYEWWRCVWTAGEAGCVLSKIADATSNTYVLTAAEHAGTVHVRVTATNGGGSATARSNSVGPVTDPAEIEPPAEGDEEEGDNPPIDKATKPSLTITGKPSVHKKGKKLVVSAGLRGLCPKGRQTCSLSLVGTTKIRKSVITVGQHAVTVQPGSTADATFVMRSTGMSAIAQEGAFDHQTGCHAALTEFRSVDVDPDLQGQEAGLAELRVTPVRVRGGSWWRPGPRLGTRLAAWTIQ